jgi:hypothetical protein
VWEANNPGTSRGSVMAQGNAVSYRVSWNGSAGDWYWEVHSDGEIIARGLAHTKSQARAAALQAASSHVDRQPEHRRYPSKVSGLKGTLKTATPRSSMTET